MLEPKIKLGIIRSPQGYSLSTVMQTAALEQLNINGEYKSYEAKPEDLEKLFKKLKDLKVSGVNVTIPHKISIIPFLDELTERAKLIGAVNTVTFKEGGKTIGDNTDSSGFWKGIPEDIRGGLIEREVVMLGCGGAACAVAIAFLSNKIKTLKIYARDKNKLNNFKSTLEQKKEKLKSNTTIEADLLANINLANVSMLVNTTPLGMDPDINSSPVSIDKLKELPDDATVYDIIYKPQETKLLKNARSLKRKTINGVEMLVRQGAESLNIWLEKEVAPLSVMRMAVLESLERDASLRGA